jgi:hypothetical protein
MSKKKSKHIQVEPKAEEIVPVEDEPRTAVEVAQAVSGEDVLTAYLRLTAPQGLMERFELEEGACKLYLALEPKNTIQAMMAVLAVNLVNASSACLADGLNLRYIPPHLRDIYLKRGTKGSVYAADLCERYQAMHDGSQKSFKVGRVNVEAGGQAIVGNVQSTRQRPDQPGVTSRPGPKG